MDCQTEPIIRVCDADGYPSAVYSMSYTCEVRASPPSTTSSSSSRKHHTGRPSEPLSATFTQSGLKRIVVIASSNEMEHLFKFILKTGNMKNLSTYMSIEMNNYDISEEIRKALKQMTTSVWIAMPPSSLSNIAWVDNVKEIAQRQLKELDNNTDLQQIVGLRIFADNPTISLYPPELRLILQQTPITLDEEEIFKKRVNDIHALYEHTTKELFLYVAIQMSSASSKDAHGKGNLNQAFVVLVQALEDSGSIIRRYLLQQLRLSHIVIRDISMTDKTLLLEVRPVEPDYLERFIELCDNNKVGVVWSDQIRNQCGSSSTITLSVEKKHSDEILKMLTNELESEKKSHWKDMLEADGATLYHDQRLASQSTMSNILMTKGLKIFSNLFQDNLKNKSRTPAEFLKLLRDKHCSIYELLRLRDDAGNPVLHMTVIAERSDFLEMFLNIGLWGKLRQQVARPIALETVQNTNYSGNHTPWRVAESLSHKNTGLQMLKKYEDCDRTWNSLSWINKACSTGDYQIVRALIESTLDPEELKETCMERTRLFCAIGSGNEKLVKYLLDQLHTKRGLNTMVKVELDKCLGLSSKYGYQNILKLLLAKLHNVSGDALENCALNGDIAGAQLLLQQGENWTPRCIMLAAKTIQEGFIEHVLSNSKITINVNEGGDDNDQLALHHAASNGSVKIIKILLSHGADILKVDKYNRSVLYLAVEHQHVEATQLIIGEAKERKCLSLLLNQHDWFVGRDIHYVLRGKDKGRKAWHWIKLNRLSLHKFHATLKTGQIDVVNFGRVIKSGYGSEPDPNIIAEVQQKQERFLAEELKDFTLLHLAAVNKNVVLAKLLLEEGADPGARDYIHATPVHYAAVYGSVEILALLEKHNADMSALSEDNQTPLQVARLNDQTKVINFIESVALMQKVQTLVSIIEETKRSLHPEKLDKQRQEGNDLRRVMIDALRDLNIDMNVLLQELGSGIITAPTN